MPPLQTKNTSNTAIVPSFLLRAFLGPIRRFGASCRWQIFLCRLSGGMRWGGAFDVTETSGLASRNVRYARQIGQCSPTPSGLAERGDKNDSVRQAQDSRAFR